jgi:hypothetical protein
MKIASLQKGLSRVFAQGAPWLFTVAKFTTLALLVIAGSVNWNAGDSPSTRLNLETCSYSNQVHEQGESLMLTPAPTHFRLMASRYVEIIQAARGLRCAGTATIAFDGHNYHQAGMTDDPGLAQLVPNISLFTGLSLADSFDLTVLVVVLLGILIGYAGFLRLCHDDHGFWAPTLVFLCLTFAEAKVADVYVFQISPLIAGIPWVLHFALEHRDISLKTTAVLLTFVCAWCATVRIGTALLSIVFLATLFATYYRSREMLLPLVLLALACAPSRLFQQHLITHRDAKLAALGRNETLLNNHPIWHAIYAGLGFIPNSEVPRFDDSIAMNKVRSIDPSATYTSPEYERILRRELLNIARQKPLLLIENLTAKVAVVLACASLLLFPARRLIFAEKKLFWMDAAFAAAIALSSMNAVLVVPKVPYLLTFFCLTLLFSSVKLRCRSGTI